MLRPTEWAIWALSLFCQHAFIKSERVRGRTFPRYAGTYLIHGKATPIGQQETKKQMDGETWPCAWSAQSIDQASADPVPQECGNSLTPPDDSRRKGPPSAPDDRGGRLSNLTTGENRRRPGASGRRRARILYEESDGRAIGGREIPYDACLRCNHLGGQSSLIVRGTAGVHTLLPRACAGRHSDAEI